MEPVPSEGIKVVLMVACLDLVRLSSKTKTGSPTLSFPVLAQDLSFTHVSDAMTSARM